MLRLETRRARRILAASLAVGLAGASIWVFGKSPSRPRLTDDTWAAPAVRWEENAARVYRVRLLSQVEMRASAQAAPQRVEHLIAGQLHLRVDRLDQDQVHLSLQLFDTRCEASGRTDVAAAARLSQPFAAVLDRSGRPLQFHLPGGLPAHERHQLREVIQTFQIVIPESAPSTWRTEEKHSSGRYEAEYRVAGPGHLRKHKTRYFEPSEDIAVLGARAVQLLASAIDVRVALDSVWVDRVHLREHTEIDTDELRVTVELDATLEAMAGVRYRRPAAAVDLVRPADAAARQSAPAAALEPSAEDVERLRELAAAIDAGDMRLSRVNALRDLLLEFPALADLVPAMIDETRIQDRTAAKLLHALELAGTPQAQTALGSVMRNAERARLNRIRAVVALGGVTEPTEAATRLLWTHFANRRGETDIELSNTAVLSLGRLAATMRTTEPGQYENARAQLLVALEDTADPIEQSMVLKALGNTGDATMAADVGTCLYSRSPMVRAAAADSLGSLDGDDTRALLRNHIALEPDGWVRANLVDSLVRLGDSRSDTLRAVDAAIGTETHASARAAMARLLRDNLKRYPESRTTLARLLDQEKDDRVRRVLMDALSQPH